DLDAVLELDPAALVDPRGAEVGVEAVGEPAAIPAARQRAKRGGGPDLAVGGRIERDAPLELVDRDDLEQPMARAAHDRAVVGELDHVTHIEPERLIAAE